MEMNIQQQGNNLADKVAKDQNMTPARKQETITEIKEQVRQAIAAMHARANGQGTVDAKVTTDLMADGTGAKLVSNPNQTVE